MARRKAKRERTDESPPPAEIDEATAEQHVRGLIVRGEAAKADEDGNLPPGATHEIVEEPEGELPKVRRRRYSAF
ncbi:MAG TPA: hypothetical protein VJT75_01145 [Thermoleophilaceae bacterium]|nr:hypothetical protein [Thermoleophilaceae bacterium]